MSRGRHRLDTPSPRARLPKLPSPKLPSVRPPALPVRPATLLAPAATLAIIGTGVAAGLGGPALGLPDHGSTVAAGASIGGAEAAAEHARSESPNAASGLPGLAQAQVDRLGSTAVTGASRSVRISRSLDRLATTVTDHRWSTADLNLYQAPDEGAEVRGELPSGTRVGVTGQAQGGFAQVVVHDEPRWVHADYLASEKPAPDPTQGPLVFQPCSATASVESGLVTGAVRAWEAVCNRFPEVSTYGGVGPRPEHDTGHAVDAMVYGDTALGYRIAAFLQAHAAELDLYDIIWHQHIWTPVRASEGWRLMPDRGSATANHMDHVHFAVN